jgi:hypothetical protein
VAGRRRYNAVRQFQAAYRQAEVVRLLRKYGLFTRGTQARIARELGVSRATICRDVAAILASTYPCPHCRLPVPPGHLDKKRHRH